GDVSDMGGSAWFVGEATSVVQLGAAGKPGSQILGLFADSAFSGTLFTFEERPGARPFGGRRPHSYRRKRHEYIRTDARRSR
ncbi:hypothetical protein, partial [Delftia tsuruhatensis]|uniref:hypothetical protein n=1 Tax=Delftia tsuruhatensis TaxID=180282 RepID=UPI001CB94A76